jgi:hypothetical protein
MIPAVNSLTAVALLMFNSVEMVMAVWLSLECDAG